MADIERGQSDPDPLSLSVEEFEHKIKCCKNVEIARIRVQLVVDNYYMIRLNIPQEVQQKIVNFLRNDKWVESPAIPSDYRLFRILKGRQRPKILNFSMWLIVAAIWPSHQRVLEIADDMSTFWGQRFPGTRPFFPAGVSDDEALNKYEGNVAQDVSSEPAAGNGNSYHKNETNKDEDEDTNEDAIQGPSKRKSKSYDIHKSSTKKQKIERTTGLPNDGGPEPSNSQTGSGAGAAGQDSLLNMGKIMMDKNNIIMGKDEIIMDKDRVIIDKDKTTERLGEVIKQQNAQIKKLNHRHHRRFKERDRDVRKLLDRVETLKAKLRDISDKEHNQQAYVMQLEDRINDRDIYIQQLEDRINDQDIHIQQLGDGMIVTQRTRQAVTSNCTIVINSSENRHDTTMDEVKIEVKEEREISAALADKIPKLEKCLSEDN